MKRFWFGFACVLIGLSLYLPNIWSQEKKGPWIVIKEKSFNAGEVDEGQAVEHTYTVTNAGDEPLVIEKVSPG